jgi:hypothetical protein
MDKNFMTFDKNFMTFVGKRFEDTKGGNQKQKNEDRH